MKKFVCLMLAAMLLTGCTGGAAPVSTTTKPTVPSQSPMEMLGQCVQKVLDAASFTLEYALGDEKENFTTQFSLEVSKDTRGGYVALLKKPCGCAEYIAGKTATIRDCEGNPVTTNPAADYYDLAYLLRQLPMLEKAVLDRFCNTGLMATPTTDGGMCFEVAGLDEAQMEQLLGTQIDADTDFAGYFILELDAGGNLLLAEYTQGKVIHRIRLTKINQKIEIDKPDWV